MSRESEVSRHDIDQITHRVQFFFLIRIWVLVPYAQYAYRGIKVPLKKNIWVDFRVIEKSAPSCLTDNRASYRATRALVDITVNK